MLLKSLALPRPPVGWVQGQIGGSVLVYLSLVLQLSEVPVVERTEQVLGKLVMGSPGWWITRASSSPRRRTPLGCWVSRPPLTTIRTSNSPLEGEMVSLNPNSRTSPVTSVPSKVLAPTVTLPLTLKSSPGT